MKIQATYPATSGQCERQIVRRSTQLAVDNTGRFFQYHGNGLWRELPDHTQTRKSIDRWYRS